MKMSSLDISNVKTFEDLTKFSSLLFSQISGAINNGLNFSDNFQARTLTANFTAANEDLGISHGLKRVPAGYIVVGANAALSVYDGSSSDADIINLKSSAVGVARILIF